MSTTSTRLGLPAPQLTDNANIETAVKPLRDALDPATGSGGVAFDLQGTHAARPSAGTRGRFYFETDTGALFRDDGTTWNSVSSTGYQPLDSDLTAIAALSTTSYGRSLLTLADAAAGRTSLSVPSIATLEQLAYGCNQAGVVDAGDGMVTQHAAAANNTVDVAPGLALIPDGTGQLRPVAINATTITIDPNPAGNPKVGSIFVGLDGTPVYSAGTAQAGATLDNGAGTTSRSALGSTQIRLAEFVVAAGYTTGSLSNSVIRDRRPWARGANRHMTQTSGLVSISSTTLAQIDTALSFRIECTGAPLELSLRGIGYENGSGGAVIAFYQDGTVIDGASGGHGGFAGPNAHLTGVSAVWVTTPSAGSHVFTPYWATAGTGAFLYRDATHPLAFRAQEIVRQNVANNATTSG